MEELAREIEAKKPDLLITISPHGPVFADAISILDLEELEGILPILPARKLRYRLEQKKALSKN